MFKRVLSDIHDSITGGRERDFSELFGDPLAGKTSWKPIDHGGTNILTRRFVQRSPALAVFKPTLGLWLFVHVFIFIGLMMQILTVLALQQAEGTAKLSALIPLGFGILSIFAGWLMRQRMFGPIEFDRDARTYVVAKKRSKGDDGKNETEAQPLDRIKAIQLLRKYIRDAGSEGPGGYTCYEMNLILEDGTRHRVIHHSKRRRIQRDATRLTEFLDVPLWDVSDI